MTEFSIVFEPIADETWNATRPCSAEEDEPCILFEVSRILNGPFEARFDKQERHVVLSAKDLKQTLEFLNEKNQVGKLKTGPFS